MAYDPENQITVSNQVLLAIENKSLTVADIENLLEVSHGRAHQVLEKLRSKGFIIREQINIPERGGRYFNYIITDSGIKKCNYLRNKGVA